MDTTKWSVVRNVCMLKSIMQLSLRRPYDFASYGPKGKKFGTTKLLHFPRLTKDFFRADGQLTNFWRKYTTYDIFTSSYIES